MMRVFCWSLLATALFLPGCSEYVCNCECSTLEFSSGSDCGLSEVNAERFAKDNCYLNQGVPGDCNCEAVALNIFCVGDNSTASTTPRPDPKFTHSSEASGDN